VQGGHSGTYPFTRGAAPRTKCTGAQRFALVLEGSATLQQPPYLNGTKDEVLPANSYVFCPGTKECRLKADDATLLVFERLPVPGHGAPGRVLHGSVEETPSLDTGARACCKPSDCLTVCRVAAYACTPAYGLKAVDGCSPKQGSRVTCPRRQLPRDQQRSASEREHARLRNDCPRTACRMRAGPEMFALRKLLPQTQDYIFNIHVMDFQPGEHLVVHEVHYNAHGLLMLQGQGVYRLNGAWFPVKAGDAVWMAPYVPQWFGALGRAPARYVLYKDTALDPLADAPAARARRGGRAFETVACQ
jgi:glyoxylate utilization-related uncharacterized protein